MTGLLADYVTIECPCGRCVLMVPARMAAEARCFSCEAARTDADARAEAAKRTGERKALRPTKER